MVAVDQALTRMPRGAQGRWQHPRLLLLLTVVALGLSANAVLSGGSFGVGLPPEEAGQASEAEGPGYSEVALVTPASAENREQACRRIEDIVQTACSLKQRDRDAAGIRLCTAHELKYTLWSAYGCR